MKQICQVLCLSLVATMFSCAGALSDVERPDKPEAIAVKAKFETFIEKLEAGDLNDINSLFAEHENFEWKVVREETSRSEEAYTDRSVLSEFYLDHYTKLASNKIKLTCPRGVSMISESRARVFFQYKQTIVDEHEVTSKYQGHFLVHFMKEEGDWKILWGNDYRGSNRKLDAQD